MVNMANLVVIGLKILRIDSGYFLEKGFIEIICMNLLIVFYVFVNEVDSYHNCVCYSYT